MMHCINATPPQSKRRRVSDCKDKSIDEADSAGQEVALDIVAPAPSTPPRADPVAWLPLSEFNNNSGAVLPPFQLHMLEMH